MRPSKQQPKIRLQNREEYSSEDFQVTSAKHGTGIANIITGEAGVRFLLFVFKPNEQGLMYNRGMIEEKNNSV